MLVVSVIIELPSRLKNEWILLLLINCEKSFDMRSFRGKMEVETAQQANHRGGMHAQDKCNATLPHLTPEIVSMIKSAHP